MVEIDTHKLWQDIPDLETARLTMPGALIRNVSVGSQYMVSGALALAAAKAGVDAEGAGALGIVSGAKYSLRLARERLLIVSDEAEALSPGWNDEGYAVTPMGAALAVFEISGARAIEIVKRATVISTAAPGPCAAVNFAGATACLYRFGNLETVRLHIDRGLAPYLWQWIETLSDLSEPVLPLQEAIAVQSKNCDSTIMTQCSD